MPSCSDQNPSFVSRPVAMEFMVGSQMEGGAIVRKAIGRNESKYLDPFVMFADFTVCPPAGFPDHPHRGFESATYVLEGGIAYRDFKGHQVVIHAGDVQWMTAGRGIIHSEIPACEGVNRALQLWINLPSRHKMCEPKCQEVSSKDVTVTEKCGVKVKVLAEESTARIKSPVKTPIMFLDITLSPGALIHQKIPQGFNAFVYVLEGEGLFGSLSQPSLPHTLIVLGSDGHGLSAWNASCDGRLRFVLIGGEPIQEPVVQHGPFVMNTQDEIDRTVEDYGNRRNGFEMVD